LSKKIIHPGLAAGKMGLPKPKKKHPSGAIDGSHIPVEVPKEE
jgi:hypothetical protein